MSIQLPTPIAGSVPSNRGSVPASAQSAPAAPVQPLSPEEADLAVQELLDRLQEAFPQVTIHLVAGEGTTASQFATQTGGGIHLGVSQSWLRQAFQSPDAQRQCEQQLRDVLERLAGRWSEYLQPDSGLVGLGSFINEKGQVSNWTAQLEEPEPLDHAYTGAEHNNEPKTNNSGVKNANQFLGQLSLLNRQLLRCVTQQDVRSVMGQAYGSLVRLKKLRPGEGYSTAVLSRLLSCTQKTIRCAKVKLRNLGEEDLLRRRAKKAEAKRRLEKAAELRREMEARRKKHRTGEYNLLPRTMPYLWDEEETWDGSPAQPVLEPVTVPAAPLPVGVSTGVMMGGVPVTLTVTPAVTLSA